MILTKLNVTLGINKYVFFFSLFLKIDLNFIMFIRETFYRAQYMYTARSVYSKILINFCITFEKIKNVGNYSRSTNKFY